MSLFWVQKERTQVLLDEGTISNLGMWAREIPQEIYYEQER